LVAQPHLADQISLLLELLSVARAVRPAVLFCPSRLIRQCHGLCPAELDHPPSSASPWSRSIIFETKTAHEEVGSGSKIPSARMPFYTIKLSKFETSNRDLQN